MSLPAKKKQTQTETPVPRMPRCHIIVAAYYFPPLGLAGTSRPLQLANYFAERGHVVTVLTVRSIDYPVYDESQLKKLHSKVSVVRSGSADPARIAKFVAVLPKVRQLKNAARSVVSAALFPDSKVGFVPSAGRTLRQVLREDMPNILITTSPPVSIHQLGLEVLKEMELKWVADFRDVWSSAPETDQSADFQRKAKKYRKDIAKQANIVTATSPKTADLLRESGAKSALTVFNGYAEDDFTEKPPKRVSSLGLYGTLNHLIGVEKLFDWFSKWRSGHDSNLKLRHIGYADLPKLDQLLTNFDLRDCFSSTGYLPHDQSLLEIRRHQANLIALTDEIDLSYVVPSKLFELLRAEPPLIAILPRGNAARGLLEDLKLPAVHVVDTYEQFSAAVAESLSTRPDPRAKPVEAISQFEWPRQFELLEAQLLKLL